VTDRALRAALVVSVVAVGWSLVAGTAAVSVGVQAESTALLGTGAGVLADMLSSVVLVWRFRVELHGRRPGARVERQAHLVASIALLVVAAGVAIGSVARLATGVGAHAGSSGIAVAGASLLVLPGLAFVKLRIARAVPSPALHTDAIITVVGAVTAAMSLVGLELTEQLSWWAADPAAGLAIAVVAVGLGVRELRHLG
jgi:divalent metal cation (Fe/Co/Zn/Cd) transporter